MVVFGKSWCPFCLEASRLLDSLGCNFVVANLDTSSEAAAVHAALKAKYKQTSVPYVIVGGVSIWWIQQFSSFLMGMMMNCTALKKKSIEDTCKRHMKIAACMHACMVLAFAPPFNPLSHLKFTSASAQLARPAHPQGNAHARLWAWEDDGRCLICLQELLGGCSDLNQAHADGKLEGMLRAAGCPVRKGVKDRKVGRV